MFQNSWKEIYVSFSILGFVLINFHIRRFLWPFHTRFFSLFFLPCSSLSSAVLSLRTLSSPLFSLLPYFLMYLLVFFLNPSPRTSCLVSWTLFLCLTDDSSCFRKGFRVKNYENGLVFDQLPSCTEDISLVFLSIWLVFLFIKSDDYWDWRGCSVVHNTFYSCRGSWFDFSTHMETLTHQQFQSPGFWQPCLAPAGIEYRLCADAHTEKTPRHIYFFLNFCHFRIMILLVYI